MPLHSEPVMTIFLTILSISSSFGLRRSSGPLPPLASCHCVSPFFHIMLVPGGRNENLLSPLL